MGEEHISNTTTDQTTVSDSANEPAESGSSHKTPFTQKQQQKKRMSSYQKTKLEYERIKEERARKREDFLKDKAK
ncbi:hypothetical protein Q8A67_012881 [Cirrhinus molitorella]|uniref:Uncharacterized protein n=1 Tax=Cirrhinus molitorella TaxID=172907 RepID=A0AA88TPH4_9TELE|nr:hypothetical protein Q8A67_012881 [Cirrhinus molitorella]